MQVAIVSHLIAISGIMGKIEYPCGKCGKPIASGDSALLWSKDRKEYMYLGTGERATCCGWAQRIPLFFPKKRAAAAIATYKQDPAKVGSLYQVRLHNSINISNLPELTTH